MKIIFKSISLILIILGCVGGSIAQNLHERPLQKLIDCPTAGGPLTRGYEIDIRTFAEGGVLIGTNIGLFPRFTVGLSYGGTQVIGYSNPSWNPQPGIIAAYRFINEGMVFPAFAVGFTNQGYGRWEEDHERYQVLAKGFYGVISKNYVIGAVGEISPHFGITYNPAEGEKKGKDIFAAVDYRMNPQLGIIAEYSVALEDFKGGDAFSKGKGYLNLGGRWSLGRQFALELIFRDILVNQPNQFRGGKQIGRELRFHYVESF